MGNSNGKPVVFTDSVNLNHFRLLRVVGKGAFGKVRIVERKDNGEQFALKYIRKDEVVRSESVRNIIRERRMLEHLRHPFLCNLRYSFQDIEYLYVVMDLMTGGDLRFHISRKTFTEDAVRFWIAELGCAIRYIHTQGIVHRDVKPDNILLDQDGHVHLADFNVASDFKPDKLLTSKSGTLAYLAPEVYEGKGYSCEVDWWSLGVVFYEAIYNKRPFEGNNHEQLGQKILRGEPSYPQTNPPISNPCLHAISSLLEKDRRQRIGAIGFQSFTDNVFFRDLDFEAVERREVEPVFLPSTEKTNFDAAYDLEELLLEEAPLEARARRQKPRELLKDDATQAEIRADELHKMIETLFEPFDYTLISSEEAKAGSSETGRRTPTGQQGHTIGESVSRPRTAHRENERYDDQRGLQISPQTNLATRSRSSTHSPNGSPPLPQMPLDFQFATQESQMRPNKDLERERSYGIPNTHSAIPRSTPDDYHDYLKDSKSMASFEPPPGVHIQGFNQGKRRRGQTNAGQQQHDPQSRSTSANAPPQSHYTQTGSSQHQLIAGPAYEHRQDDEPPVPVGSGDERDSKKPSGMLGFLSRKKGRDRSPKAKERGVLGKEGARQIINEKH